MSFGLSNQISIRSQTTVVDLRFVGEAARMRRIEALEAANFEVRDQITRVRVHNATLDRMLNRTGHSTGGSAGAGAID
jgi:hypothetical protein